MLRKILNIILVALLLMASTGFTVSKHYCGEELISVAINEEPKTCCDGEMKGCCTQETLIFQIEDNFFSPFLNNSFQHIVSIDLYRFHNVSTYVANENNENFIFSEKLPPPENTLAFLTKLQVFLL